MVAIFKNEAAILREWIDHYLMEGVEHFYLIDNDSSDDFRIILKPYIDEGVVECVTDNRPHMQVAHYNSYYQHKVKTETEWVIVVDLDEFIYSRLQFKTISAYLKSLDKNVAQVFIPWKLYGSSGLIEQPKACVDSFTKRTEYKGVKTNGMISTERMFTKTILRTQYLVSLGIHSSHVVGAIQQITSDGQPIIEKDPCYQSISEKTLAKSALHNNHYPIQSYEWFRQIKMTRGSAAMAANDKVRTNSYYNSFDSHSNQIIDNELAEKRGKFKAYYGTETYWDVTRHVYRYFTNPTNTKIIIDKSIIFNDYFGDPKPGRIKSFIVRQNGHLTAYPETHNTITITLS